MVRRKRALVIGLTVVAVTAVLCLGVILWTLRSIKEEDAESAQHADAGSENAETVEGEDAPADALTEADISEAELLEAEQPSQEPTEGTGGSDPSAEGSAQTGQTGVSEEDLVIRKDPALYTYEDLEQDLQTLTQLYPDVIRLDSLGTTPDGRSLYHLVIGDANAERKIFVNGGIHAREYMTSQLVMKQAVSFLEHLAAGDSYQDSSYENLLSGTAIHVVPMINPDGITISQMGMEGIRSEEVRAKVESIAQLDGQSPSGSYLVRWKANANGVDLNRNFDALWEEYQDPAGHPSADHYKGSSPGSEPESAALIDLTVREGFDRTISYHTQGSVIYWYFAQEGQLYDETLAFAERISLLTGYQMDANYESLDPAGYKDWAIRSQQIPSLTIEVGRETSPVPAEQFEEIWKRNEYVWEETLLDIR